MDNEIKERMEKINQGIAPEGYKKTKAGIIPEDWEVKKFKKEFKVSQGLQIPIKERCKEKGKDRYVYITNKYINNLNDHKYETEYIKKPSPSVICNKNDILMTRTGNTGIVISGIEGVFHNNFFKVDYDIKDYSREFLIYLLKSNYIQHEISSIAGTSTIPDLTHSDFYSLESSVPPLSEQQKIAEILSTWDRGIENIEKLIKEKETQKKWLMQQLLTGKTRLPGFTGEWKEVKLGDLGRAYNGLSGKTKDDFGKGCEFITYKNVFDNSKIDLYIHDLVNIKKDEKQNLVKYGDIFFTISSETPYEVGMSSVLLDEVKANIYLNSFCFGFRLKGFLTLLPEYASFYFREDIFRSEIYKLAQGSTRFNVSKTEIQKIHLNLPPLPEQKAIAEILSTADQEIQLLKELLENKKQEKKGLMKVLLTGIVRV